MKHPCRLSGQSAVEYLIVLFLLSMALVSGPDSALEQFFRATTDRWMAFGHAMSRP